MKRWDQKAERKGFRLWMRCWFGVCVVAMVWGGSQGCGVQSGSEPSAEPGEMSETSREKGLTDLTEGGRSEPTTPSPDGEDTTDDVPDAAVPEPSLEPSPDAQPTEPRSTPEPSSPDDGGASDQTTPPEPSPTEPGTDQVPPDQATPDQPAPPTGQCGCQKTPTQLPAPTTIYYVCDCGAGAASGCKPGDDSGQGTKQAPWRSYEKARQQFGQLKAGEAIAFCRGGAFVAGQNRLWMNTNCRANSRCFVQDYAPSWGAGSEPRPIIRADGDAFSFANPGGAVHEEGYVFRNLHLIGANKGQGFFFFNDTDDVLLENLIIDSFDLGVHVAGFQNPQPGSNGVNERIALRNSILRNNGVQGFLGAADGTVIENNQFENNGFQVDPNQPGSQTQKHSIYIGGTSKKTTIRCNDIYRSSHDKGSCIGAPFVVHGAHTDLLIEYNTVREDPGKAGQGCWGLVVDPAYPDQDAFKRVTIRGNTVSHVGNVAIGVASCQDCLIENNFVHTAQGFGMTGIAAPNRGRANNDLPMARVTIRNNTVYFQKQAAGIGILLGSEGSGYVLVNNIVLKDSAGGDLTCFALDLPKGSYTHVDHNICYGPQANRLSWGHNGVSLAAWRQQTGFDQNSKQADPKLTGLTSSPPRPVPASGSPAVDAGHPTQSSSQDLLCTTRTAKPDIGAFERTP